MEATSPHHPDHTISSSYCVKLLIEKDFELYKCMACECLWHCNTHDIATVLNFPSFNYESKKLQTFLCILDSTYIHDNETKMEFSDFLSVLIHQGLFHTMLARARSITELFIILCDIMPKYCCCIHKIKKLTTRFLCLSFIHFQTLQVCTWFLFKSPTLPYLGILRANRYPLEINFR